MNVEKLIERLHATAKNLRAIGELPPEMSVFFGPNLPEEAATALAKLQAERDEAVSALEVCRESLVDQAAARADPAMPLLVASVRERLEGESEAVYAMSESREDRIYAHGLSLLCDWQKAALKLKDFPEGAVSKCLTERTVCATLSTPNLTATTGRF